MVDFGKLKNGREIAGHCGPDAAEETRIDRITAGQIGGAFAYWLSQKVQKNPVMLNICVGRSDDSNAEELAEGLFEAIALWGAKIHDAGIVTADAAKAAPNLPCFEIDGAIMVAADSSMAFIKLYGPEGEPSEEERKEILRTASRYNFIGGEYEKEEISLMKMYELYK